MSTVRKPGARWLIYALGGGLGHLTRALALARFAQGLGHSIRIITNSPFATNLPVSRVGIEPKSLIRIDPTLGRDPVAEIVGALLKPGDFDVLIVDTFPRGLGGEMAPWLDEFSCPKVLIHRDLNPDYVAWAELRAVADRYELMILPGEDGPLSDLPRAVRTAPWLLQDRHELLGRAEARLRLGVPDDQQAAVVVVGSGRLEEVEEARDFAGRLDRHLAGNAHVRLASGASKFWPLLDLMAGIDVLVGSGGYNTVHEARATATPLVAIARNRKYDRQAHRLSPIETAADETDVFRRVAEIIARRDVKGRIVPPFENGVHEAVRLIEKLG